MNSPVPGYLVPNVLGGTLAVVAAVTIGLYRSLKLAGWAARERRQAVWSGAVLLVAWFFAALIPAWFGVYGGPSHRTPTIQYGLLVPIIVGVALYWQWSTFRRVIQAVPNEWLVGVQVYRVEGLIFLALYAGGHLPGLFAWPAGVGDVLVGLLAPIVSVAYARRSRNAVGWLRAWNLLGIADLILAVTTGFLTSPSPFQMFAFGAPNELIGAFPLVMIPVFLVPLSILLHFASLLKLRQTETERHIARPVLAGGRS